MQSLDVISINIWQILISLCNLLIIFLLVKKFLYKPVRKFLAKRQESIDKIYTDAEKARNDAESDKAEYSEKLSNAEKEALHIVKSASEKADRVSEEIISEANEKVSSMLRKADEDIARERKKAVNEIKDEISGISVDIAQKIVEREINENDHKKLIDAFIDEIGDDNG